MILRDILFEELTSPEAPEDAPFGQYLFAPDRTDTPKEANTSAEAKFRKAIEEYFHTNDKYDLGKVVFDIMKSVDQGFYETWLKTPPMPVWRVISNLSEKSLEEIINLPLDDFGVSGSGTLPQPMPFEKLQGWTTDPSLLPKILKVLPTKTKIGNYTVVVRCLTNNNNFFLNPGTLATLIKSNYAHQQEVISVGSVKYDSIAYVKHTEHSDLYEELQIAIDLTNQK